MQSGLDRINEIVTKTNTTDFVVHSFRGDSLLLTGSFDHCYYHELEVHFHVVSYIGLPVHGIDSPHFSIATDAERRAHNHLELTDTDTLFKIHADPEFRGGHSYYVAAESVRMLEGTVFYYMREDLKPNERIAEWVERKG